MYSTIHRMYIKKRLSTTKKRLSIYALHSTCIFFPTVVLLLCYICCEYIKNMPLSSWENWVHPPGGRLGRAVFAPRDQGHRQWPQVWQPHPIVIKKLQLIAINCKKQCCKDVTNMHTSFGKKLGAPPRRAPAAGCLRPPSPRSPSTASSLAYNRHSDKK